MIKRRNMLTAGFAALLALGVHAPAMSQDFPTQPVMLVVPFPAGGITDAIARALAQSMSATLGQPVVVSNKPGAGGQIAASVVTNGKPDGHKIFVGATEMFVINPTLYRRFSYDPLKDFAPVTTLSRSPLVLVVKGDSDMASLEQLTARAQSQKGQNFASQGIGSIGHLLGEQFKQKVGGQLNHVAYRGSAPALQDLAGGQVDMMFDPVASTDSFIKAGKLKPLAIAAEHRAPQLPNVATLKELGVDGVDSGVWFGAVVKAGTPAPIVKKLNEAFRVALQTPNVTDYFMTQGMQSFPSLPEAFDGFLKRELARWVPVLKASGVSLD